MKKRIVLGLVLLASLSMLISSLARAESVPLEMDSICSSAQTQYLASADQEISNDQALLSAATDDDTRDLLRVRIIELQKEKQDLSALLEMNCP